MIEFIEGRGVGSGKSYYAIERALRHWAIGGTAFLSDTIVVKWEQCKELAKKRYGVVLQDSQYRAISDADLQRLHEVTLPGTADMPVEIYVDEAQGAFNARDWSDKSKRPFFSWLCQSRHDDNDVIILSQASANVDKQVRRLCTFYWVTRNSQKTVLFGWSISKWIKLVTLGLDNGFYFIRLQLDSDGKNVVGKNWVKADRGIFGCYESKSMRLKHRRGGGAVGKLELERVKRGRWSMGKVVLVVMVLCGLFAGFRFVTGGLGLFSRKGAATVATSPATVAAKVLDEYVDGQVIREALRSWSFPGFLQTAVRTYRLGRVNELGLVVATSRDGAVVQRSPKVRVRVETYEDSFHNQDETAASKPFDPMHPNLSVQRIAEGTK